MSNNSVLGVIPARMGSTRYPGKPLELILGKPMLWHIWQRSQMSGVLDELVVATCDHEIREACEAFGARVIMTSDRHTRAGDRVAEAAEQSSAGIVLNIQGDEPLVHPDLIREVVAGFAGDPTILCVNPIAPIDDPEDLTSPNTVKVVCDLAGRALYFSRYPIPSDLMSPRKAPVYRQVPILGFRREFLFQLAKLAEGPLEQQESVDLLRALEHGLPIHCVRTTFQTVGVDVPADVARVERLLLAEPLYQSYAK
jgi:3-deoxy-manno-octulosonate cytidylyltransferase (CMP-KDO synthetase)